MLFDACCSTKAIDFDPSVTQHFVFESLHDNLISVDSNNSFNQNPTELFHGDKLPTIERNCIVHNKQHQLVVHKSEDDSCLDPFERRVHGDEDDTDRDADAIGDERHVREHVQRDAERVQGADERRRQGHLPDGQTDAAVPALTPNKPDRLNLRNLRRIYEAESLSTRFPARVAIQQLFDDAPKLIKAEQLQMQLSMNRLFDFCEDTLHYQMKASLSEHVFCGMLQVSYDYDSLAEANRNGAHSLCLEQRLFLLSMLDDAFDAFKLLSQNTAEHELEPWNDCIHQLDTKEPTAYHNVMAATMRLYERKLREVPPILFPEFPRNMDNFLSHGSNAPHNLVLMMSRPVRYILCIEPFATTLNEMINSMCIEGRCVLLFSSSTPRW